MLVYGTANPVGFGDKEYNGLYLSAKDIQAMIPHMKGIPIKIEHKGVDIGKVVTAWEHDGRMDVMFEINANRIEVISEPQFCKHFIC